MAIINNIVIILLLSLFTIYMEERTKEKSAKTVFTVLCVSGHPQSDKKNAGISELKKVRKLGEGLEK